MDPSHNKTRVLLVDDDADICRTLGDLLRSEGYDALVAGDAHEAMQNLSTESVDLIISDLMMPGVNGAELLRRLARDPRTRRLPTILLTAAGVDAARDAIARAEIETVVVHKPVRIPEFLALLQVLLQR